MHTVLWYLKKKNKTNFSCKGKNVFFDMQGLNVLVEKGESPPQTLLLGML